jgi:hypothetical protein
MATVTNDIETGTVRKIGVQRLALTGALAAGLFYLLCWIGAQLPIGPATHAYLTLFTNAELSTGRALVEGLIWSVAFGLIAGALVAAIYNAFAFLDRR